MKKLKAAIAAVALTFAVGVPAAGAWKCEKHPEKPNCTGPYPTTTTTVPEVTTTITVPPTTTTVPAETSSTSTIPPFEIDDVGPDYGTPEHEKEIKFTG